MKKREKRKVVAVVPAAGSGVRMRAVDDKPFLELSGRPLLAETLTRLGLSDDIDRIVVAARKNFLARVRKMVSDYGIAKVAEIIAGGETRTESVRKALFAFGAGPKDIILIHDGVRPFVSPDVIRRVVRAADSRGAAVTAVRCSSTIKRSDDGCTVSGTLDRSLLWEIQTPQAFRSDIILEAYRGAPEARATDDSALVERLGGEVAIVEGDRRNIKVTVPEDLDMARSLLVSTGGE